MLKLNFKRLIATVVTAAVAFVLVAGAGLYSGEGVAYADAASEGFIISDYNVDVVVTENRIYKVKETITCDFNQYKHGIYRYIPTVFTIERADGSRDKMVARVENFKASTNWEAGSDSPGNGSASSYFSVKLGNADQTVIGMQQYTISYDYVCSADTLKGKDEFYFNIIGAGWNTDISHVTFSIKMPKDFEAQAVGFSMGSAGTAGTPEGQLYRDINGRTISGETLRALLPNEAITIRMELPDGYFTGGDSGLGFLWVYAVVAALALVSIFLCFKLGRDDKIIPVIQFEPPEGYNSLDVGVMDHLDPGDTDVLSLLIYLADKGYLTIEPLPDWHGSLEKTKKFCFHKVKEYDGDNICERVFLEGLFRGGTSVRSKDLEKKFYLTVKEVAAYERGFTSELVSRKGRGPITLMILASLALMYMPAMKYGGFFNYLATLWGKTLIGFWIAVAAIIVMIVCWGFIQRRTPLGVELAGKARGFAEFIETAEKDRIEQMIEDDPESFYRVIPYAMALGVTDKWIKKFKGIALKRPSWYMYDTPYLDGYIIGSMIGSSLQTAMKDASAIPSSSGSGGISAGGAGGGGGGSW